MKTKPKSKSVAAGGGSGGNVYLLEINNQHTIMAVRRSRDDKSLFLCVVFVAKMEKPINFVNLWLWLCDGSPV